MEKVIKYFFYYFLILLIYLLPGHYTFAQGEMWKYYIAEYKDLPNSTVYAIAIDSNKTVWFGTSDGLASFDGTNWKQFDLSAYHAHPWKINKILVDKKNIKWICTAFGLFKYDDSVLTYIPGLNPLWPDDPVYSAALDKDDNLYLSLPELIVKYNGTPVEVLNLTGITGERIKFDKSGSLWISNGDKGVLKYDGQNLASYLYTLPGSSRPLDVSDFDINSKGEIWVVGMSGLGKLYNESWAYYKFSDNVSTSGGERIRCGKDGNIYFTTNYGVIKFDGITQETLLPGINKDNYDICRIIEFDTKGTMWIGTDGKGAIKIENGLWTNYSASYGLPDNSVNSIAIDKNNIKWIGTDRGLTRYDGINWTIYNKYNSPLLSDFVNKLFVDENNVLWIGTLSTGLARFDDINWGVYTVDNSGLLSNSIHSLSADKDTIWISTSYGLTSFGGGTWKTYTDYNSGLTDDWMYEIAVDKNGYKWIIQTPLTCFDGKTWLYYKPGENGWPNSGITSVFVDAQNRKWFSTGSTIVEYDDFTVTSYNTASTGTNLVGMHPKACDKKGNIIFGSAAFDGLVIYNGQSWIPYNHQNPFSTLGLNISEISVDCNNNKWLATGGYGLFVFNENGLALSTEKTDRDIPTGYRLLQNYPNPFNGSTKIEYYLPRSGKVSIKIYNILGEEIKTIVEEEQEQGKHSFLFNGEKLASGVYLCRLVANGASLYSKMILLK